MPDTVNSSVPEEILEALEERLDELQREERAEWDAFVADPSIGAPQHNAARDVERSSILVAIEEQRQIIADREDVKKKKKAAKKRGDRKPDFEDDRGRKDDEDGFGGGKINGVLQTAHQAAILPSSEHTARSRIDKHGCPKLTHLRERRSQRSSE